MLHLKKNQKEAVTNSKNTIENAVFFSNENEKFSVEDEKKFLKAAAQQIIEKDYFCSRPDGSIYHVGKTWKETSLDRMSASKEGGRD